MSRLQLQFFFHIKNVLLNFMKFKTIGVNNTKMDFKGMSNIVIFEKEFFNLWLKDLFI